MPGLSGAGAGRRARSIWRIDGITGKVRLFANVTLDDVPNSGPALGGLAFGAALNTLLLADSEAGMIHRFDLRKDVRRPRSWHPKAPGGGFAGSAVRSHRPARYHRSTFQGRRSQHLGLCDPERLIFGLAVYGSRLCYAVTADLEIWSVALADGSFGEDARTELKVSPLDGHTGIAKIAFDTSDRMLLAERGHRTGAYDFETLAKPSVSRVLRHHRVDAGWQAEPDGYAIGFAADLRNGDGGIAIGYGHTPDSRSIGLLAAPSSVRPASSCARQTTPSSPCGLPLAVPRPLTACKAKPSLVRPADEPPLATYFVDYDDQFADDDARGHLGDVAIRRMYGSRQGFAPVAAPEQDVMPEQYVEPVAGWGGWRARVGGAALG